MCRKKHLQLFIIRLVVQQCRHSGYSGRSGVYELIAIDETLQYDDS